MKRYLLFCGDNYYPEGGWADFTGDFDTVNDARFTAIKLQEEDGCGYPQWHHIVDTQTRKIVEDEEGPPEAHDPKYLALVARKHGYIPEEEG